MNIIELAKEAGIPCFAGMYVVTEPAELERFAALVRAEALEQAEERVTELYTNMEFPFLPDITAAIRGLK